MFYRPFIVPAIYLDVMNNIDLLLLVPKLGFSQFPIMRKKMSVWTIILHQLVSNSFEFAEQKIDSWQVSMNRNHRSRLV